MRQALESLGVDLDVIAALEPDAALGNGGLGRLAACFMESMATVDMPAHGYGIRYAHGLFRQEIADGWQVELPETWLDHGNPWEFERRERSYEIGFGGQVESVTTEQGAAGASRLEAGRAHPRRRLRHAGRRLARQARQHAAALVGAGDRPDPARRLQRRRPHRRAAREQQGRSALAGALSGRFPPGRAGTAAAAGIFLLLGLAAGHHAAPPQPVSATCTSLPDKVAIQLNDTHPAIAVPELMRLLMDVHGIDFDEAWDITKRTFAYTNHTLLPEALESWPVPLFERLLPRHMQIIYAINAEVLHEARAAGSFSDEQVRRDLADRRGRRPPRAHGQPRLRRLAQRSTASRRCTPS